jgi:hypothetical protein
MRIMTIGAADFAFQNRMVVRQLELRAHFQVTLETSFRGLARIDDRVRCAAAFYVQAPRAVTRLASDILCIFSFGHQARMRRGAKVAHDFFVAGPAFL